MPQAAADAVSGRKPGPTVSSEKRKARAPGRTGNVVPPCCPCEAACEVIEMQAGRVPNEPAAPLCGPCTRRAEAESQRPERSTSSIFEANSDFQKTVLPPLVPAILLGSGALDFSTRIKGGGRKAPASRSQRPAVRGVSRDCGILPQRKLRWSLNRLFGFQVVVDLRKSRGSKRFPAFSPTLCTAMLRVSQKLRRLNKERKSRPELETEMP